MATRVFRCLGLVETDSQGKHRDSALVSYVSSRLKDAAAKKYKQLARQYPAHDDAFVLRHCSVLADAQSEGETQADDDESVDGKCNGGDDDDDNGNACEECNGNADEYYDDGNGKDNNDAEQMPLGAEIGGSGEMARMQWCDI